MRNAVHCHSTNCGNLAVARHMTHWASVVVRRTVTSIVLVWAMCGAPASASPILFINPSASTVNVGATVELRIEIADVTDLFFYNFDLLFDPNILEYVDIVEGAFLKSGDFPDTEFILPGEENPGIVSFISNAVRGDTGVTGGGTLAIATFLAVSPGISAISIPESLNEPDQPLLDLTFGDSEFNLITFAQINGASVRVNQAQSVPDVPSPTVLLISVLALAACRKFTDA